MKKILIVHHGSGIGGGLIALVGIIKKLDKEFNITVLCIFNSEAVEYLHNLGIKVILPKSDFYKKYYDLFVLSEASFPNILNFLRGVKNTFLYFLNLLIFSNKEFKSLKEEYDYLYLNSLFITDWLFWSKNYFRKVIVHVREPLGKGFLGIRRKVIRFMLNKYSDTIIAISKDNAERVNILNKTKVLYDPVLKRETKLISANNNYIYFTYVGGSQRIKGVEDLLNSLEFLNKNIKIFFIGSVYEFDEDNSSISFRIRRIFSPYLRKVLPKLKEKYLKYNNLIKVGSTNNVFGYYKSSVGLIAPFSKPHACLPVLEAMSIGLPCIVSNITGMTEFFNNKKVFVYSQGNPQDLASKINELSILTNNEISEITKDYLLEFNNITQNQETTIIELINELNKS